MKFPKGSNCAEREILGFQTVSHILETTSALIAMFALKRATRVKKEPTASIALYAIYEESSFILATIFTEDF